MEQTHTCTHKGNTGDQAVVEQQASNSALVWDLFHLGDQTMWLCVLIVLCGGLMNDSQVCVISIPVIGSAYRWKSLACPWQNPPLHGPLLKAKDTDVMVGDPYCVDPWSHLHGRTLPSLQGIPNCHHDIGNSESPLWSMLFHLSAPSGEGVRLLCQAMWKQGKQVGDRVWAMKHGIWDESCIVMEVWVHTWQGWFAGWRGRDQYTWVSASYRGGATWCPDVLSGEPYLACPGWKVGAGALRTSALCWWRFTARCRCWCAES